MFYGRSGTGKTTVAGTFPGRKLVCDIKDVGDDSLVGVDDLDVMDINSWEDFETMYWYVKKNPKEYDCLVLDTMSQLQQLAIRRVLEDKKKDPDKAGEWGSMTKQDWGAVASLMKTWIINVRDLPMNVVFIAQDRTFNTGEEDEAQGLDPEVGPALSPSIAKTLNAAVHVVGNTFIRKRTVRIKLKQKEGKMRKRGAPTHREEDRIEFCMRIGPNQTYITKLRKPKSLALPDVVVDPTYDKLINIIEGKTEQGKNNG